MKKYSMLRSFANIVQILGIIIFMVAFTGGFLTKNTTYIIISSGIGFSIFILFFAFGELVQLFINLADDVNMIKHHLINKDTPKE